MLRLRDAIWWFLEALGRAPLDDDLAFGLYREIEFKRPSGSPDGLVAGGKRDEDALRRAG